MTAISEAIGAPVTSLVRDGNNGSIIVTLGNNTVLNVCPAAAFSPAPPCVSCTVALESYDFVCERERERVREGEREREGAGKRGIEGVGVGRERERESRESIILL